MTAVIRLEGLFRADRFSAWTSAKRAQIRRGVGAGMTAGGIRIRDALRAQMRGAFALRRARFANVMTYRVWARRPDRLPALQVGALRAGWLESHEIGATIRGRGRGLVIPINLNEARIGRKKMRKILAGLSRQGNLWFENVSGRVLVFAEDIPDSRGLLQPWKRALRAGGAGAQRRKHWPLAIAVVVPTVRLRKRLKVQETVQRMLLALAAAIEAKLGLT